MNYKNIWNRWPIFIPIASAMALYGVTGASLPGLQALWLVLALQLSTVLLVLAGPVPAPLAATPGGFTPAEFASRHDAPVPSSSQP